MATVFELHRMVINTTQQQSYVFQNQSKHSADKINLKCEKSKCYVSCVKIQHMGKSLGKHTTAR